MRANSLAELDRLHRVHSVSADRSHGKVGVGLFASARAARVVDVTGRRLADRLAGQWRHNAGYEHDSIVEATACSSSN